MPSKRKPPAAPDTAKLARERARARVGAVPPTRRVPDKRKREKYKPDLRREAADARPDS